MVFFCKQKTAYEMLRSLVGSEMCIRDRFFADSCAAGGDVDKGRFNCIVLLRTLAFGAVQGLSLIHI